MGVQLSQEELDELVEETRAEALKEAAKACDLVAKEIDDTNGLATYCGNTIRNLIK